MKVEGVKRIDGCLEGRNVWDFLFDEPVEKDFIDYLADLGKLVYQGQMEKPFYTVIVRGKYTIKGSEGNKTFRVILPEDADLIALEEIKKHSQKYSK